MKTTPPDIADSSHQWVPLSKSKLERSSAWWKWVTDPGSLTQRLKEESAGEFRVELTEEQWINDLPRDLRCLFGPVSEPHKFWSRKVTLLGRDTPWVRAHTLIPEHSLLSPLQEVLALNTKPLGEYLFNHPELIRTEMDVTVVGSDTWARRSLFYLFSKPVLVAEFFLPSLIHKIV